MKIIGISVDPAENNIGWSKDIEETQGTAPNYPIIGDSDFKVAKAYGMLPAEVEGEATERTPAQNATVRNVYVIGPDKKIKLVLIYPMTTGRNFDEVLRVIDSLQLTANHAVATPAQWQPGEDVIIAGSVSNDAAKEKYPEGWKEPKPYIRIVPAPRRRARLPRGARRRRRGTVASVPRPPRRRASAVAHAEVRRQPRVAVAERPHVHVGLRPRPDPAQLDQAVERVPGE